MRYFMKSLIDFFSRTPYRLSSPMKHINSIKYKNDSKQPKKYGESSKNSDM